MFRTTRGRSFAGWLVFCLSTGLTLNASPDWPQWRGPNRDGISADTGLLQEWPNDGPPLAWTATGLGRGYSGVAAANGKIYTAGDGPDSSFVRALDLQGKPLWSARLGKPGDRGGYAGPRCTPTVDGALVYMLGQFGDLVCVEAATGKERWRKSLPKEFGGEVGGWGYSESPLVDGQKVICTPGGAKGALLALDKNSGATLWRTKDFTDSAEYASPIVVTTSGVRQYVQLTGRSVVGVAADDGRLLWRADRRGSTAVVPTPIFHDDQVYVTSGYGIGCQLFKISRPGDKFTARQVYANKNMVNHHGGVVRIGEHLYGYSDGKGWVCQDFKTGEIVWRNESVGKGSIACADGRLYLRSERGKGRITLVEASSKGYKEVGRFDQPQRSKENSWPHPVITGGKLYLRDQDVLLCYEVKK
jgi:outer membrane protein assembly factor BamB